MGQSNGVTEHSDDGKEPTAEATGEQVSQETKADSGDGESARAVTVRRRGEILRLLEGAGIVGDSISDLAHDIRRECPEATLQLIRHDLIAFIEAKLVEERPPRTTNGPELYIVTMKGENACEGQAWHKVAESVTPEEQSDAPAKPVPAVAPTLPQDGSSGWAAAIRASQEKEAAEKAEAATKNGKGKKASKDEPSPQLGLGSRPGRFVMDLPCPVREEEIAEHAAEVISIGAERDALDEEKSAAMKRFAERREGLEERDREARAKLKQALDGTRVQPVECEKRLDGSTMTIIRADTAEVVERRAATAAELEAANPPPATVPAPEGVEVREAQGQVVSTNEPTESAPSTEQATPAAKRTKKAGKTPRGSRKAKGDQPAAG